MWHFTRWVNEDAHVQKRVNHHAYRIEYSLPNGSTLHYFLEDQPQDVRNFYEPAFEELEFKNGTSGLMDLRLYKIGQDEMTLNGNAIKPTGAHGFDAILTVQINVQFKFVKNHLGTDWGSVAQKKQIMTDLEKFVVNNNRRLHTFTLENASAVSFKKILLYFQPRYHLKRKGRHFQVEVRLASGISAHDQSDIENLQFTKKNIKFVQTMHKGSLFRYMLGLPAVSVSGTPSVSTPLTTISPNDLAFLVAWVQSKCGGTYTCQQYI